MSKVLVLGASGIVGQHMRLHQPRDVTAVYVRQQADPFHVACDLSYTTDIVALLDRVQPDVIVNLAGESRPDMVKAAPSQYAWINAGLPLVLVGWCGQHEAHLIHVSSQAVFSGQEPPYGPTSPTGPINTYGRQKVAAERLIQRSSSNRWTIARLTFILGVRPLPLVGRENPLEQMLRLTQQVQTGDRWFSPLFAHDAAQELWRLVDERPRGQTVHLGLPERVSRAEVARAIKTIQGQPDEIEMVSQDHFIGAAVRPVDTTYAPGARHRRTLTQGIAGGVVEHRGRFDWYSLHDRAVELAYFLQVPLDDAKARLGQGFVFNHHRVTEDFRAANPQTDDDLLRWYRETAAYCWELSAYHLDLGFNYRGMCSGIATHLVVALTPWRPVGIKPRVLCIGDGIGDLTLTCLEHGLHACYHDLAGSVTAQFATFRFWRRGVTPLLALTEDWCPVVGPQSGFDAVIALDFMEHVPNVEEWTRALVGILRPGGLLLCQNAFAVGDDEHGGSIPMHLSRNNRFEKEWDPLLESLPLERQGDTTWWRKK